MEIDINNRPLEQDEHFSEEETIMQGCVSAFIIMCIFILFVLFLIKLLS